MMPEIAIRRQFITDTNGQRVAVVLPIEEYETLVGRGTEADPRDALMAQAAHDERFMCDLRETMEAFAACRWFRSSLDSDNPREE